MSPSTPLRAPADYFERWDRPSLAVGAAAVVVQSVLVSAAIWWFMQGVLARVDAPPDARAQVEGAVSGAIVLVFVGVFVGWVLYAGFLHLFVWFADGDRGFGTTLAVVGESELVSVLLFPVTLLGFHLLLGRIPADPQAAAEFFDRAASFQSPLLLAVSLAGAVWKALIQGVGLAVVHDIEEGKTLALTLVLALLGFVFNLL